MSDFVSFEIAKKLKEKGYPLLKVIKQDGNPIIYDLPEEHPNWQNCDTYYIPTIYQVLKWMREEKSIYVTPCVIDDCDTDADGRIINRFTFWSFDIQIIETSDIIYSGYNRINDKRFDLYEEAVLAGIEYALDKLI